MSRTILTRGALAHDGAHGFKAREARHGEIEQEDVGFEFEGLGDGVIAVVGVADDFKAGLIHEHVFDAEADDGMVVCDNDADVGQGSWNGSGRSAGRLRDHSGSWWRFGPYLMMTHSSSVYAALWL